MAIFTDKVVSATFMDYPQNTIVDVIYKEGDQNISYVLEVDFTQEDFKALLQEITLDEIESNTKASVDIEKKIFTDAVEREIERRWALESEKVAKAYSEADQYAKKAYSEADQYAKIEKEKAYSEVEIYLNNEKEKAFKDAEKYTDEEKQKIAKELQEKFNNISSEAKFTPKNAIDYLNRINEDKDPVFNMKIAVLEDPIIATSKDKSLKMKIRKAKTIFEILEVYSALKV